MTVMAKEITRADILDMAEYGKVRAEKRRALVQVKRNRRVPLGPHATFYFENYETMWQQVHEMLFIERGGEEQIPDELSAYNPLIPQGRELVATLMFEIDNPVVRKNVLSTLGGVEETVFLRLSGEEIVATSEEDVDRTTADGKASSVQFVHFHFTDAQAAKFADPKTEVVLGIKHPNYSHMTVLSDDVQTALAQDFD
ncbi:DUF3501 family protein [Thalassobaculum sp.]|uniref:DUF3501 family protein n=1 Tax=Thalassobaculum sp. TaxID=2022740 RepID=UPI0032EF1DEC